MHLDTSFLIRALIPGTPEEAKLRGWLRQGEALVMSSVAWTEFLCGPLGSSDGELADRFIERRRDFTPDQAALADSAAIATSNRRDFSRFATSGLKLA